MWGQRLFGDLPTKRAILRTDAKGNILYQSSSFNCERGNTGLHVPLHVTQMRGKVNNSLAVLLCCYSSKYYYSQMSYVFSPYILHACKSWWCIWCACTRVVRTFSSSQFPQICLYWHLYCSTQMWGNSRKMAVKFQQIEIDLLYRLLYFVIALSISQNANSHCVILWPTSPSFILLSVLLWTV